MILPFASRHAQQLGNIDYRKLHLHFDNSKRHTVRYVQEQMANHQCVRVPHAPPPYSPDLAIAAFYLFGRLKEQLSGRTLDTEEDVLETITEILSELPKNKVRNAFLLWKEKCQWVTDHNSEFYPN
jgi:4-alpha-glucanotransferase